MYFSLYFFEKELLHNCFSCILINMCWWLFLLIKSQKMKSTVIPAFIFVINFEMKQNVSETKGIWHFRKNVKTCLQHKKSYLMPPSRHDHFHPVLILPVKMVELPQQHANTIVHWLQTLPLPIVAKSSVLNVVQFLDPSFKTSPCINTSPVPCDN